MSDIFDRLSKPQEGSPKAFVSLTDVLPKGDPFHSYYAEREQVLINAAFGNDGASFSGMGRLLRGRSEKIKTTKEITEFLGNGHLSICYCCPYIEKTLQELSKANALISKLSKKTRSKVCSAGLVGNIATWERLLALPPEQMIGNGLQHCVSRAASIVMLWGDNITKEAYENTRKFLKTVEAAATVNEQKPRFTPRLRKELLDVVRQAEEILLQHWVKYLQKK